MSAYASILAGSPIFILTDTTNHSAGQGRACLPSVQSPSVLMKCCDPCLPGKWKIALVLFCTLDYDCSWISFNLFQSHLYSFPVKLVAFKPFENFSIKVWNKYLLTSTYVPDRSELASAHPLLSIVIPYSPLSNPSSKPMCVGLFEKWVYLILFISSFHF